MSSKIQEGTLGGRSSFVVRKLTKQEYEAEAAAADSEDAIVGLTNDQAELRNRATGEASKATSSTSDLLAAAIQKLRS